MKLFSTTHTVTKYLLCGIRHTASNTLNQNSNLDRKMKLQQWRKLAISVNRIAQFTLRPLHNGPDTLDELLDRHVVKTDKSKSKLEDEEDEILTRRRLTSTRREALSLYRDILRATRFFSWVDSRGYLWKDVLRENARKEFEEARFETDPEVITRLLIGGHDAVQSAIEKLVEKQKAEVEKAKTGGGDRR